MITMFFYLMAEEGNYDIYDWYRGPKMGGGAWRAERRTGGWSSSSELSPACLLRALTLTANETQINRKIKYT